MKKLLFLFVLMLNINFVKAETVNVDESKVDIYFGNGVKNTQQQASEGMKKLQGIIQRSIIKNDPTLQAKYGKLKLSYNWGLGDTNDLLETFYQLKEAGQMSNFSLYAILSKLTYGGLNGLSAATTVALMTQMPGIAEVEQSNVDKMLANYYLESFQWSHRVLLVSHSQGNMFANRIYDSLSTSDYYKGYEKYFTNVQVGSPASSVHAPDGKYITNRGDLVINPIPGSMIGNANPDLNNRVSSECLSALLSFESVEIYNNCLNEKDNHQFVPFYLEQADPLSQIIPAIQYQLDALNQRETQWNPKEEGCTCEDKYVTVTHEFDDEANILMEGKKVKDFTSVGGGESKIYTVTLDGKEQHIKASFGGTSIEKIDEENSEICYILKDEEQIRLGEVRGSREVTETKDGVVEIFLNWNKPELDYDLIVEWDAGEVDVKDTGCGMEHFHILSEKKIYPGTYRVSIVPKDPSDEGWEAPDLYPFEIDLITRTPGASDKMHFEVKNQSDITLGHVSDIKVFRVDDENNDNTTDDGNDNNDSGDAPSGTYPSSFIIVPDIAPECPPVQITPSPVPPTPIYFPFGGSGGWSWSGSSGGTSYGGGGAGAAGAAGTSGYTYPVQQDPGCGGDVDCLPTPSDSGNNSGNPETGTNPYAPTDPIVGGTPVRDLEEEDGCKGDMSCHCIPCEYEIIPYLKQIYFGPLRDANFSIYSLDGYLNKDSLFDGKTTNGNTLYDAGEIDVPQVFLNSLEDDKLYIIEAQGGEDIDSNDDFVIDTVPTKNLGKVYAIASGKDIKYTGFKVNILTTVAFTLLEQSIKEGDTEELLAQKISQIASRLLKYKVYPNQTDSNITNVDLLAWLPTVDQDLLLRSYVPLKEMVVQTYAGENIYAKAYEYVFYQAQEDNTSTSDLPLDEPVVDESEPPIIKTLVASIDEDAQGGTVVGKVEVIRGSSDISFGELSGKGSEVFEVNSEGEVKLREGSTLDYETKWLYKLRVEAFNKNGGSGQVAVYISVGNILDAPEYIRYEGGLIDENITSGTVVGQMLFDQGASPITEILMNGTSADIFTIDTNGTIRLAEGATLDYETKYSYGFVVLANNSYGSSMPVILYINIRDIADTPQITNYTGGYVHEDAIAGTFIGQVEFNGGGSAIENIYLSGEGSENFTVDMNGTVRVSDKAMLDYETYVLYKPTVIVENSYGSATRRIFVSVVDKKDVPTFTSFSGGNVKENSLVGTVVAQILFDPGSMPIDNIVMTGEGSEAFKILDNGIIVVAEDTLNYEERNHYIVKVTASNALGSSAEVTVHILVDDVSERPAILEDFVVNNIDENLSIGTVLGQITILDQGSSAIELFEISGTSADEFSVDAEGNVSIAKTLDFEQQEIHNLRVKAKNSAGFGNEVNLIVRLSDIADIAPKLQGLTISIEENATAGTLVGQVNVLSTGDRPITEYILNGDGSEKFDVNASGAIYVKENDLFDYETQMHYYLTLMARNEAGESNPVTITVNILNSPDVLSVLEDGVLRIDENSLENTMVGNIKIITTGDSSIDSFEISGFGAENFDIDENGILKVSANATLDYENITNYSLQIKAHSVVGYSDEVTYIIWVDNLPDLLPVLSYISINNIEENLTQSTIVGKLTAIQSDSPITGMTLSGSGSEKFIIDNNGTLRTIENAVFNYESEPNYVLYVVAQSASGNSEPLKIIVPIGNVEENPKLAPFNVTIDENATVGMRVGQVSIIHSGDSPIISMVLSGTGSSDFTIDVNGTIRVSQTAKLDYETRNYYRLKVVATNKNGNRSSYGYYEYAQIGLNNLPDEPVIKVGSIYTVDESASVGTVIGKINIKRSGDSAIEHFEFPYYFNRNGVNIDRDGVITVGANTLLNYEDSNIFYLYTLAVNENGNKSNVINIPILVNNIPDEPILKSSQVFSVEENATIDASVGVVEVLDTGDSPITAYEIVSDYSGMFKIDNNGTIKVNNNVNFDYESQQKYYIYIRALNESGKYSKQVNIRINIGNVPDEPIVPMAIFNIEENATTGTVVGNMVVSSHGDSTITSMQFRYGQNNFVIDSNGTIRIAENSDLDYERQNNYYNQIKVVNETGNVIYTSVTINLTNIPDEPVLGAVSCTVEEHSAIGTKVCRLNIIEEGDSPVLSIDFMTYDGKLVETPFSIDRNGTITVKDSDALDYESKTYYSLNAIATNESGKKSQYNNRSNIYIDIKNDLYDAPRLERKTIYVDENSSVGTKIGNVLLHKGKSAPIEGDVYTVAYNYYNQNSTTVSDLFSVDMDGNIIIKNPLDYDTQFKPCQNVNNSKRYCEYVNIKMTNTYGSTTLYKQEIEIGNVADSIPMVRDATFTIDENATIGTQIGKIIVINQDEENVTQYDLNGSTYFDIDSNGTIILKKTLDYERNSSHLLYVTAHNLHGASKEAKVTVQVTNIMDEIPILSDLNITIDENAIGGTVVGTLAIVNNGDSPISQMTLFGEGAEKFSVSPLGVVMVESNVTLDYESKNIYDLTAIATNQAGQGNSAKVTININDIRQIILKDFVGSVKENSPKGTIVGTIDMDTTEGVPTNITLSGSGAEDFSVDVQGVVRTNGSIIDFEIKSQYILKAIATNSELTSNECNVVINVVNQIDTPPIIKYFSAQIEENSVEGTIVGVLDIQSDEPITDIKLTGVGSKNFLVSLDGTITVSTNAQLNYEEKTHYSLRAVATNSQGDSEPIKVYVSLINVPDTLPTIGSFGNSIREDSVAETSVGSLYIKTESPIINATLSGSGSNNFTIDNKGNIKVSSGATLDYETKSYYNLDVSISNDYGTQTRNIVIYVYNVPDTPPNINVYKTLIVEDKQNNTHDIGNKRDISIWSDSSVDSVRIEGEGAEDFIIDTGGNISIAPSVVIDITKIPQYNLSIIASNTFGESEPKDITIEVHYADYIEFNQHDPKIIINNIVLDKHGNFYLGGTTTHSEGYVDYPVPVLLKYDASKTLVWTKEFDVSVSNRPYSEGALEVKVYIDSEDRPYLAGTVVGDLHNAGIISDEFQLSSKDTYIVALEEDATTRWIKQFGTIDNTFVNMQIQDNSLYIVTNLTYDIDVDNNISTDSHGVIYSLDLNGTLNYRRQYNIEIFDTIHAFEDKSDSIGFTLSGIGDDGLKILDLDKNVSVEYSKSVENSVNSNTLIKKDLEGNMYFVDSIRQEDGNVVSIWKYNKEGILIWSQEYSINIDVNQIYIDDNGFWLNGTTYDIGRILEFDNSGTLIIDKKYGLGENETKLFISDGVIYLIHRRNPHFGES